MVKLRFLINAFLLLFVSALFTACPYEHERETLILINNTDDDILWTTVTNVLSECDYNPWTTTITGVEVRSMDEIKKNHRFIKAGDTCYFSIPIDGYKVTLEREPIPFYFFNYDSICTIPWQRICDERILLKEVVFESWEELEDCKFTIKIQ